MAAGFPGGTFIGNPGGKGGPMVQPWFGGAMGGALGAADRGGYGGDRKRRFPLPALAGAMPFSTQSSVPASPPIPNPDILPHMNIPEQGFNRPPNVNVYKGYPGFHPLNIGLDRLGSYWKRFGTSQGEAKRLNDAALAFNGMSFPGRQAGGAGFGLSEQPSDALRRLLAARFGGV